jgi:hypothetical protein
MQYFILLILFLGIVESSLQNRTKLLIMLDPIEGIINTPHKVKLLFHAHKPFHLILYTTNGIPLHFKGIFVSYIGNPTYYVIKSLDFKVPNKIIFEMYTIGTDWIKVISIFLAVCAMFILIMYKREHKISQLCLFILLLIEVYKTSEYDKIADRIIHKILF